MENNRHLQRGLGWAVLLAQVVHQKVVQQGTEQGMVDGCALLLQGLLQCLRQRHHVARGGFLDRCATAQLLQELVQGLQMLQLHLWGKGQGAKGKTGKGKAKRKTA
jgi:hypothetical protein